MFAQDLAGTPTFDIANDRMKKQDQTLIALYVEMAQLTAPECATVCRVPFSCCSPEYCEASIDWAKKRWGIDLPRVNGKNQRGEVLPLLGGKGCTAAPHLRPTCTVHTCDINGLGCKKGDPAWTAKYFKLREQIEQIELIP
ncbi:MAG TPA: hypothetical protein VMX97_15615 [Hyphomicrobiaceae bacterium]|nr:hypothetical protein [Hyphomicrobiaceae bacterium]